MEHLVTYLSIAAGGALGAILRFLIAQGSMKLLPGQTFPYGTLAANLLGSLLLGFLFVLGKAQWLSGAHRLFWTTGMMGALTTFSTFAVEGILLMQGGHWKLAVFYWIISVSCGVLLAFLGYQLGSRITGTH
ncbi:MAG: fluoride efflux transporter CrcB [Leptospiraceae bacterium]|nr:fluoride efflux transporter CrcB [Leptospiraceae bacterium]MCB1168848.1 fluoride efflux transporter CrcB [Leptospiraceae bacterium]